MIGMPRITLTIVRDVAASNRMPETRISAQISPSTVDTASEPIVTRIVSRTPVSRMGMNSIDCARNRSIGAVMPRQARRCGLLGAEGRWSQAPLCQDLVYRPVGFQLGKRRV